MRYCSTKSHIVTPSLRSIAMALRDDKMIVQYFVSVSSVPLWL